jgi:hypothetical protein
MTAQTAEKTPVTTTTTARKPSRATRSAAQAKTPATRKPASTAKASKPSKPKADAQPKGPTATQQKEAVTQVILDLVAKHLSTHQVQGVDQASALAWAGSWLQYLPGCRQQKVTWPDALGAITGAGAAKKS